MTKYQSIKTVDAQPMDRIEAENAGLVRDKTGVDEPGYKIVYQDGYTSWSPAAVFEQGYVQKDAPKSLGNTTANGAAKNVKDIVFWGDGDTFKLISKASSEAEGWMKSTKAMPIDDTGCVVQVTTQQRNPDGSYSIAEAVTFVPDVGILSIIKDGETEISSRVLFPLEKIAKIGNEGVVHSES